MKISYFSLVIILFLNACSQNEEYDEAQDFKANIFPQEWILVKMTGSFQGSETMGQEMYWQERYVFNADSSFSKTREQDGTTTSAEGEYTYQEKNGEKAYILTYKNSTPLIGNCTVGNSEYLYFDEDSNYLLSNWWACDGPGLFYERVKDVQSVKKSL